MEDEIEAKRRGWELREVEYELKDLLSEREYELKVQRGTLADKKKNVVERMNFLDDREKRSNNAVEEDIELKKEHFYDKIGILNVVQ